MTHLSDMASKSLTPDKKLSLLTVVNILSQLVRAKQRNKISKGVNSDQK